MNAPQQSIESLNVLLQKVEAERDAALADWQRARDAVQAAQLQSDALQTYRQDYQKRWSQQFGQQGAIEIVHCYQSFHERLDQAVDHQQRTVLQAQSQVDRAFEELQQREMRVAAVKKLIERRTGEAQRQAARHEQKQTDESAQRASWTRNALSIDANLL